MIGRKGNAGFSVPVPQLKCLLIGTRNPGKFLQKNSCPKSIVLLFSALSAEKKQKII